MLFLLCILVYPYQELIKILEINFNLLLEYTIQAKNTVIITDYSKDHSRIKFY